MKKVFCICMTLFLLLALPVSVGAAGSERALPLLVDEAGLLYNWQVEQLNAKLEEISTLQQCDVAVVVVNTLDGKSAEAYADDFYDYNGYGYGPNDDGILLLIGMKESKWAISTYGYGIYAFTDAGQAYMTDRFVPMLSDGDFYEAFDCYAELCELFLIQAATGDPYDVGNLPQTFNWMVLVVGFGIGAIIALISVSVMKGKLKSVRHQHGAANYSRPGSFAVRYGHELFLYQQVLRTRRESSSSSGGSSTRSSSSGRSHGGSSGSF